MMLTESWPSRTGKLSATQERFKTPCSPWWLLTTLETHEGCGQEDVSALATEKKCSTLETVNMLLSSTKLFHSAHKF